ncbi:SecDF P1 head subdomain-containing protein [Mesorhizobium sp. 131-2-1]|uniref:SecDF P1 head subdomain-containing protein n=1 Tax=Mesorhizobium sp. 131-2-1 TaxID=2744518 RepID=UPI001929388E|nr:hypothetical protein [Mesorhizobium sp. 131-2-1]BCG94379.1 hypothetical protein MesoLj131a_32430 [Mesorhizobium sp. 131-2-1]
MRASCRLVVCLAMLLLACGLAAAQPLALAVAAATVVRDPAPGQDALDLKLTPDSAKAFAAFTVANVGRTIDLSVDGAVVMSPRLLEPILGGEIMVGGRFSRNELRRLAERISSGSGKVTVDARAE